MKYYRNTENGEINTYEELKMFFFKELTDEDRDGRTFEEWLDATDPLEDGTLERLSAPQVLERRWSIASEYGYSFKGLVPISLEHTLKLVEVADMPIYALYGDDTESLIEEETELEYRQEIYNHHWCGHLLAVEIERWNEYVDICRVR